MPNPFAHSRFYTKMGNVMNVPPWRAFGAPPGFAVLTTRGRKSGKPRRIGVRAIRDGDRVYVASMVFGQKSSWLRNARANPKVALRLGRKTYAGTAREIVDPEEKARARQLYVDTITWWDYVDHATYLWDPPTKSRIKHTVEKWYDEGAPVVIELTPHDEPAMVR